MSNQEDEIFNELAGAHNHLLSAVSSNEYHLRMQNSADIEDVVSSTNT